MSNKNSKTPKQERVSINQIIDSISRFEFDKENSKSDTEEIKEKKPKTLEQIQRENLLELLNSVEKLEKCFLNVGDDQSKKIEELNDLIKEKLGDKKYILDLRLALKFINENKNKNPISTNKIFKNLIDLIARYIDAKMKDFFSVSDYEVLSELSNEETIESDLIHLINFVYNTDKKQDKSQTSTIILSQLYTFVILKHYKRFDFKDIIFTFERLLCEKIAELDSTDRNKFLLKSLPDALLDNNPKTKSRTALNQYLINHNKDLKNEIIIKSQRLEEKIALENEMLTELNQLREREINNNVILDDLKRKIAEKDAQLKDLDNDLRQKSDLLEFETNIYENQLQDLKSGIVSRLQRDIQMELDGMTSISNKIGEESGQNLRMYITNITQLLNSLQN